MPHVHLTPGQAVSIHGWLVPRQTLTWSDVLSNEQLCFRRLLSAFKLQVSQLYVLQPDLQAWVKAQRVRLEDAPQLLAWGPQPVKELGSDLADIASMGWPPETLVSLGVTYSDLVALGLTAETMPLFAPVTLLGWAQLGFRRTHAEKIPAPTLSRTFGMSNLDVLICMA